MERSMNGRLKILKLTLALNLNMPSIMTKQNLCTLVVYIANFREQMKVMHQGMDLYIDPKGRRKEGKESSSL